MPTINSLLTSRATRISGLITVDALFFGSTNAANITPLTLMIGLLLTTISLYWLVRGVLEVARLYGFKHLAHGTARKLTIIVSGLIALQSIGQLTLRDIAVFLPLLALAYFYFSYGRTADNS